MIRVLVTDNRPKRNPAEYHMDVVDDMSVRDFSREVQIAAGDGHVVFNDAGVALSDDTKLQDKQSLIIDSE